MNWKGSPFWIKGTLIAWTILVLQFPLSLLAMLISPKLVDLILYPVYFLAKQSIKFSELVFDPRASQYYAAPITIFLVLFVYFLIGALAGLIISKFKKNGAK